MSEVKLSAQPRSEFGKGASRRLRRDHLVPAVLYGHGTDPVHVALPGHATMLALKNANALLTIELNGETQLALPKDVQRHPIRQSVEHVDLLIVRRGEKVTVDVQLHVVGDAAPGTMLQIELNTLSIEVEATNIPQSVEYDITGATAGSQVQAGQITLPEGATLIGDPEAVAVLVTDEDAAIDAEDLETPAAEGDEAAEGTDESAESGEAPAEA